MIISASRRCDLPAWGMDAFMADLRAGFRLVPNPFDASKPRRVSLEKGELDCIVFWTRDPRSILANCEELHERGFPFYVQLTITGYPKVLEPGVLETKAAIDAARALADRIGREFVLWRYDPIVLAGDLDPAFHLGNFGRLAGDLAGATSRVTLSILDEYRNTKARLRRAGYGSVLFAPAGPQAMPMAADLFGAPPPRLPPEPWPSLLGKLATIAREQGMEAVSCAEPWDLESLGIGRAACIDPRLASRAAGRDIEAGKDKNQRPGCGCAASVDVGAYGPCPAACVYCYARR